MPKAGHNRTVTRLARRSHTLLFTASGGMTSRAMDRMFASVALGCTAKPETCASAWTGSGTPLSVCAPKGGCAGFKIRKLALAVAKQCGGIAPTPPGVNVRLLMWPRELINNECSPGCSSRQPGARIYEHTGPQFSRWGGQSAASSIVTSFRMIPIEQGSGEFSFVPSSLAIP